MSYFENNNFNIDYRYNIENDFSEFNRNNLKLSGTINNFYSAIDFENKKNHVGDEKSGKLTLKKLFKQNYYLNFEGKKNLKTNDSEYIKFGINFENDCLIGSLAISNDFYSDKDIKKNKSLIFSIIIKPFSDSLSPDLSEFIN